MRKLLAANFHALFKNKVFWIMLAATALISAYVVSANYNAEVQASENPIYLNDVFFTVYQFIGVILAATTSLIIGVEYSDGTLRNKLVVGHRRSEVYLAALIANLTATLLFATVHGVVTFALGSLLLEPSRMPTEQLLALVGLAALGTLALDALFTGLAMNCESRAVSSVASLLLALTLIVTASTIGNKLQEPELSYDDIVISEDGIRYGDLVPNPAYVDASQRPVYEFVYDLFPAGQLIQISSEDLTRADRWPAFSASFLILAAGGGYLVFRRKNLR